MKTMSVKTTHSVPMVTWRVFSAAMVMVTAALAQAAEPKGPPPAGLRVGFMAYYAPETELVIKAAGIEDQRRVEAACSGLHPLTFTQGGGRRPRRSGPGWCWKRVRSMRC